MWLYSEKHGILMSKSMKRNFRKGICLIFFFFTVVLIWGFSPLEEGEKLLMSNNPREALPFLEQALNTEPLNEKIYLYLGILYEQLAQPDKAISIMQRGLDVAKEHRDIFYYNIGNNFFIKGENMFAEEMYTKAIGQNSEFADPYLNRANSRLSMEEYRGALNDYTVYLRLKPTAGQRLEIEKMIELLRKFLEEQEQAEKDRLAQEKALMNQVLNLLKNASDNAQNLSTGTEGIVEEEVEEIDIED